MSLNSFIEYLVKERNYSNNTIIAYKNDLEVFQKFCQKEFNHKKRPAILQVFQCV